MRGGKARKKKKKVLKEEKGQEAEMSSHPHHQYHLKHILSLCLSLSAGCVLVVWWIERVDEVIHNADRSPQVSLDPELI